MLRAIANTISQGSAPIRRGLKSSNHFFFRQVVPGRSYVWPAHLAAAPLELVHPLQLVPVINKEESERHMTPVLKHERKVYVVYIMIGLEK